MELLYMFSDQCLEIAAYYQLSGKVPRLSNLKARYAKSYDTFIKETSFTGIDASASCRIYHILSNTTSVPMCLECGINKRSWQNTKKPHQYSTFCSTMCSNKNATTLLNRQSTLKSKYGVSSYSQTPQFRDQIAAAQSGIDWDEVTP